MSKDDIKAVIDRWHSEFMRTRAPRRTAQIDEIICFWETLLYEKRTGTAEV